ncbi:MAG: LacI family DNA-binding transcriptional regulator [Lentisphaeria bacterium]|nr:LacI family DNA-binding transcriptional regulator [Lentisphaeria bacterium]
MKSKVTEADIAKLAKVSQATVSRALDPRHAWRFSAEKRAEILSLCRQHGYPVGGGAKHWRQTFKIGLLLGSMERDLRDFRFMIRQLCDLLQASGYTLTLIRVDFSSPEMSRKVRRIIKSSIADLYIIGSPLLTGQTVELLHSISRRIICFYTGFDTWKPAQFHSLVSTIRRDYETSFTQAVEQIPLPLLKDMIFFGYHNCSAEEKLHLLRKCLRRQHLSLSRNAAIIYGSGPVLFGVSDYRMAVSMVRENLDRLLGHKLFWTESSNSAAALKDELARTGAVCGRDFEVVTYRFHSELRKKDFWGEDDFCRLVCDEDQFSRSLCEMVLSLVDDPTPRHLVIPTRFEISRSLAERLAVKIKKVKASEKKDILCRM